MRNHTAGLESLPTGGNEFYSLSRKQNEVPRNLSLKEKTEWPDMIKGST